MHTFKEFLTLGIIKVIKQTTGDVADNIAIKIINAHIKNYGTVQSLKIDRVLREIDISLTLHGEKDPVQVLCKKYSFHAIEEIIHVRVESFFSCRPWLNAVLNDFVALKLFPLDHPQAKIIPIYLSCTVLKEQGNGRG